MNRIATAIEKLRPRVEALDLEATDHLSKVSAIDFHEHFAYQQAQAEAHASGKLTAEEAQIIYNALGEHHCSTNGGWVPYTDLTTKVIVTQVIGELLKAKLA